MVRWNHIIFSAYGHWLPNDPRGSWSSFVASDELYVFGSATKTAEKRSLSRVSHDRQARLSAKQSLRYPAVRFNAMQRMCITNGIECVCPETDITILALAIGYDHIHCVVKRHDERMERIVRRFKSAGTREMTAQRCHPLAGYLLPDGWIPSPWSRGCWSVFIEEEARLRAAITYVQEHAAKEGLPAEHYRFVQRET